MKPGITVGGGFLCEMVENFMLLWGQNTAEEESNWNSIIV